VPTRGLERLSFRLGDQRGAALTGLLSTDGYANSFRSDEDFLKIGHDYLEIIREQGISSWPKNCLPSDRGYAARERR